MEAVLDGRHDVGPVAVLEPQGEQPQDVLLHVPVLVAGRGDAEVDGPHKPVDRGHQVPHPRPARSRAATAARRRCPARRGGPLVQGDDIKVEERPMVPGLVPLAVELRGVAVRVQDGAEHLRVQLLVLLLQPEPRLEVAACLQRARSALVARHHVQGLHRLLPSSV